MSGYINDASIAWLQAVFDERFGEHCDLQNTEKRWCLFVKGAEGVIEMDADPDTFKRSDSALPLSRWDATAEGWQAPLDLPLPAPGLAETSPRLVEKTPTGFVVHYDVLGLVYWMLTRQEEVGRSDLDEHRRFPAAASHAYQHDYLERPVVDEWLAVLGQIMQRLWPSVALRQSSFPMRVSHDVDSASRHGFAPVYKLFKSMAGAVVQRRDFTRLRAPLIRLGTHKRLSPLDIHNTFDWLMSQSEQRGLTSAFYFICNQRGTPHDSNYDLEHPAIRDLIRRIHRRGHEIGLHPSYATYLEPEQIQYEADRLRRVCAEEGVKQSAFGGRMHYLQWRQPETLRAWENAGMAYDSTMTYADAAGFRCGTCFEYPAFDPVEQKMLNLRIRPLVCMEGSVFGANYMNLGVTDAAQEKMLELKNKCRAVNGCFTLLWHNSSFKGKREFEMYQAVLDG